MRAIAWFPLWLLLAGDGAPAPPRDPDEAAAAVLRQIPAETLVPALLGFSCARKISDLPGFPDLKKRAGFDLPPLRYWFTKRGVHHSDAMLRIFRDGFLRLARGEDPDWEGLTKAAAAEEFRRFGPEVDLPWVARALPEPDKGEGPLDLYPNVILAITEEGRIWLEGDEVTLDGLSERLFPWSEMGRDEVDPRHASYVLPVLRVDGRAPWTRVQEVLDLLPRDPLRFARAGFLWFHDETDDLDGGCIDLPWRNESPAGPDVLRLAWRSGTPVWGEDHALARWVRFSGREWRRAVVTLDRGARVYEAVSLLGALYEGGISDVRMEERDPLLAWPVVPTASLYVDGEPLFDHRTPEEAVRTVLTLTPAATVVELIEGLGAALTPADLPGFPELWVRAGQPGARRLRGWFERRGLDDRWEMDDVLRTGLLAAARGASPDFEAFTREARARQGPPVELPFLPREERHLFDDYRSVKVRVGVEGEVWHKGKAIPAGEMASFLFPFAELRRDEYDDYRASEVWLELRADRRLKFRGMRPLLRACRDPAVRIRSLIFDYLTDETEFRAQQGLIMPPPAGRRFLLPEVLSSDTARLRLAEGPDRPPGPEEITAALARCGDAVEDVLLVVEDDVPVDRIVKAAVVCHEAGKGVLLACPGDVELWVTDPPASACLDGVPIRARPWCER